MQCFQVKPWLQVCPYVMYDHVLSSFLALQSIHTHMHMLLKQDLKTPKALGAAKALPRNLIVEARGIWRMQAERRSCVSSSQDELYQVCGCGCGCVCGGGWGSGSAGVWGWVGVWVGGWV